MYTQPNGQSTGGNAHPDYLCPDAQLMVAANVRAGDWLDYVQGDCDNVNNVVGVSQGQAPSSAPPMGNPSGGNAYGLQECPPGHVITGMSGPTSNYPRRVSWFCSQISYQ